jgi:glutamate-1-semialdehyde 2,1-aminomutase
MYSLVGENASSRRSPVPEASAVLEDLASVYAEARPRSRAAFDRARRVLPGGLTHEVRHLPPFLPYIVKAAGARKWDADGYEYVDLAMGHGALLLGHAHPAVVDAVAQQVRLGTHPGANHLLEVEWAERVRRLVPGAELVRFTNSGTEATLLALRVARVATGKTKVVKFQGHFHGWHDTALPGHTDPYDAVPAGIPPAVAATTLVFPHDLDQVETVLHRDPDVAAVIVEPSGPSWGTVPLPPAFLRGLREVTRRHGVCLVFDEVITGFRWAPGGAQERYGVRADLVTLAKILAGGLPGGAVAGREDLLACLGTEDPSRRLYHPGTFNANPLSASAGIACLDIVADPEIHARCDRAAETLRQGLNQVLRRRGVRGVAYGESSVFHLAFDPALDPGTPVSLERLPPDRLKGQRRTPLYEALTLALLVEGVHLFAFGGFLSTAHGEQEIARTVDAFDRALERIEALLPR